MRLSWHELRSNSRLDNKRTRGLWQIGLLSTLDIVSSGKQIANKIEETIPKRLQISQSYT